MEYFYWRVFLIWKYEHFIIIARNCEVEIIKLWKVPGFLNDQSLFIFQMLLRDLISPSIFPAPHKCWSRSWNQNVWSMQGTIGLISNCQFQWWLPVVQPWPPLTMACGWHAPLLSWLMGGCRNDLIEAELGREFQSRAHCPHYYSGTFAHPSAFQ